MDDTAAAALVRVVSTPGPAEEPSSSAKALPESAFEPPPSTELPSERFARRGTMQLVGLLLATCSSGSALLIASKVTGMRGIGLLTLFVLPILAATIIGLMPLDPRPASGPEGSPTSSAKTGNALRQALVAACLANLASILGVFPLIGEGVICMVMALPITFALTATTTAISHRLLYRWLRRQDRKLRIALGLGAVLLLPWLLPQADRVLFFDDADRAVITTVHTVPLTPEEVWTSLTRLDVRFAEQAPAPGIEALLPQPRALIGEGTTVGAVRRVLFDNGEVTATVVSADPPRRYDIDFTVQPTGPEFFDHWLDLLHSRFELHPRVVVDPVDGAAHTVTDLWHVTTFRPLLYPRFVYGPLEQRFGTRIQARLVDAYLTDLLSHPAPSPPTPTSPTSTPSVFRVTP